MKIVEILEHCLQLRPHIILLVYIISLCSLSFCEQNGEEYQADYGKALDTTTFDNDNKDTNFNYRRSTRSAQGKQDSCNLILDDSATFDFHEMLADNSGINLVAFRLFSGSENDNSVFQNMTACWIWASVLGQVILSVLPEPDYSKCTLKQPIGTFPLLVTFTVAKRNFDVKLYEKPNGCLGNMKTTTERVILVTTVLQQHFLSDQLTKNKLCYRLLSAESEPAFHCCKYNGKLKRNIKTNDQMKCDTNHRNKGILVGTSLVMFFLIVLSFMYLSEVEEAETEFIKTTENPLSVLSIMLKVFCMENGIRSSFLRFIFQCVFIFMMSRIIGGDAYNAVIAFILMVAIFCVIFCGILIFSYKTPSIRNNRAGPVGYPVGNMGMGLEWWEPDNKTCLFRMQKWPLKCLVLSITCLVSPKHWKWKISSWYKDTSQKLCCHGQNCQPVLNCICASCLCFLKSIGFLIKIFLLIIYLILHSIISSSLVTKRIYSSSNSNYKIIVFWLYICATGVIWRVIFIVVTLVTIPDLLLGLLLNAEYYMTYVTFCSVMVFYTINFWNSVQEQYFSLKSNIYKVCKEKFRPSKDRIMLEPKTMTRLDNDSYINLDDNNDIIVWKYDEENVPMISKYLYDHITEKLLPYNFQVFHYLVKLLIVFSFAYCIIFKITHLLMPVDISPSIKVFLTAFVSAIPYILNVLGRKSEKEKKADCEAQIGKIEKIISELCLDTNEPVSPVI